MKIAICASISFYKQLNQAKKDLLARGFEVSIPPLAEEMEKQNDYVYEHYIDSFYGGDVDGERPEIIRDLLNKVAIADATLVINEKKHNLPGYIGGNVLMEMGVAFEHSRDIYLLNKPNPGLPYISEINAMQPIILNGDLKRITRKS